MKRRHSGHSNNNTGNGRRNYNSHSAHGGNRGGNQKPRKNYPALKEKFLNMAKDAMASGDRVLAEYYLQHADHYFRMQQDFLAERAARQQQREASQGDNSDDNDDDDDGEEEVISNNSSSLPAFLTHKNANQNRNSNNNDEQRELAQAEG